jgi:hypothetical protein
MMNAVEHVRHLQRMIGGAARFVRISTSLDRHNGQATSRSAIPGIVNRRFAIVTSTIRAMRGEPNGAPSTFPPRRVTGELLARPRRDGRRETPSGDPA